MEKLLNFVSQLEGADIAVSNDKIKQTERNAIKKDVLDSLLETFANAGLSVFRTNDGVVLSVQNAKTEIFIAVDAVIKNLDYDVEFEVEEYDYKIMKQEEREAERKLRAEERANAKK